MDHFKCKGRRGAVHVQSNGLGPTVRHGTLPTISTAPAPAFSPMPMPVPTPKTTASFDALSFGFGTHPVQLMQSEFTGDYYRSASPLKLDLESYLNYADGPDNREMSTISSISADTFSSTGSMFSSSSTDTGDTLTVRNGRGRSRGPSPLSRSGRTKSLDNPAPSFVCLGPQCQLAFSSDKELNSHVKSSHTHICNWAGCDQPSFSSRDGLIHHVKVQHLVICPSPGCVETSFQSIRILQSHISMAHPEDGKDDAKEWGLPTKADDNTKKDDRPSSSKIPVGAIASRKRKSCDPEAEMDSGLSRSKRQCLDQLRGVVEKRARKSAG
jgi:DNA polymerase epsilon subunit 1